MKNTAMTTVRKGRQSSDNTYVRIAAAEQNLLDHYVAYDRKNSSTEIG